MYCIVKNLVGPLNMVVLPMPSIYNAFLREWITPVLQYHKPFDKIWLTYYTRNEVNSFRESDDQVTVEDMITMYNQARPWIEGRTSDIWPILATVCDAYIKNMM